MHHVFTDVFVSLQKPERDEWGNGLTAMQCALQLEKNVNQALLDLHKVASEKTDPHVSPCSLLLNALFHPNLLN